MSRHVKGVLFVDYVKMIRKRKDIDWSKYLHPEDLEYLEQRIVHAGWYPLEAYERMGIAILEEIAMGELEAVRLWGRYYMNTLFESFPSLLAPDDPTESLMRFKVMGRTFFDFDAVTIESLVGHQAQIRSEFGMSPRAEEASAHQLVGFFERLMDAAGADDMEWEFLSRRWAGDDATIVQIEWHKANPSLSYSRER